MRGTRLGRALLGQATRANMRRRPVLTAAARRVAVRALTVGGNGLAGGEGAPVSVTRRADLQCRCSGGIRAFGGRRRLMITCPLPSPLDLGRTSKFAILSSVSSSTRQMASSTAPITKWQRAQVIPRCSSAMPCDDTEIVEHACARRTLPHGPSPPATSTPRRLHTHAPSRSALRGSRVGLHPPTRRAATRQMSCCSTRGPPWRT